MDYKHSLQGTIVTQLKITCNDRAKQLFNDLIQSNPSVSQLWSVVLNGCIGSMHYWIWVGFGGGWQVAGLGQTWEVAVT